MKSGFLNLAGRLLNTIDEFLSGNV